VLAEFAASAQTKISGTVNDAQGKALASSTVSLLKAKDSSLVKVALVDKAGQYEFLNVKDGNYLLAASFTGYSKKFSSVIEAKGSDVSVPAFSLSQASKDMNNVVVTAKRPFVETKLDKTVVNVDASPTSAGASALDMLEKSPGVSVDNDGNISLRGKQGVIVMVDGKPTYLSATDLANMLKNMPASALDQIEIMTNPSSKYDASGNSGIINIKTKKGKNNGFNGSFQLGAATSIFKQDGSTYSMPKSQNSFNFNYKKNKVNFFGSYNPNFFRGRGGLTFDSKRFDPNNGDLLGYNNTETKFKFGNFNQTLKLGVDYYANKKNVFGVVASGFLFNGHPTPVTIASISDVNNNLESQLITKATNKNRFENFTGNLNWRHTFDSTGKEFTADFDYVKYYQLSRQTLATDVFDGSQQQNGYTELQGRIPANIDIYSFKTDYTKPFKNGRFEAGIKSSYVKNDNLVDYQNRYSKTGNWLHDNIRSNHFIYEENINAAYVNVNRQIKKWTLQGGLRVENTIAKGDQVTTHVTFKRNLTDLFPTAFASYELNKKNTLSLSYGRRINRPNYQDLNPFIFFLDTLSFRKGNPNLKPQYTNNIELTHAFKGKFITTFSYNNTRDVIAQIIRLEEKGGGNVRSLMPDNVAKLKNMALSVTVPIAVAKWWNINLFTNVYNNHYTGVYDTINIDQSYTSFMFNLTNSFTIAKGFTAELSGFYRYKSLQELTQLDPIYQMTLGLQKQIMKSKGTLRLNIRDPFAWQKYSGLNNYGYVYMKFRNTFDSRQITATFTLRFGKQMQQQQRRRVGSSQEEQSRVGGAG
jgi:outer membrane receptor protein involved in Fe transport